MSWCEFDNWSSSGVQFDQRLMTKYCSRITSKISKSSILKIIRTENSILDLKNHRKFIGIHVVVRKGSWKYREIG